MYKNGAIMYNKVFEGQHEVNVLIAKKTSGKWNVDPSTNLFSEKAFSTKTDALKYARTQMKRN